MKIRALVTLPALILTVCSLTVTANELPSKSELHAEALSIVKTFGGTLKPQLKAAIQSGGLEHAIQVCATQAPKIAKKLSKETGWDVKRVSLKSRNAKSATPSAFEEKVLTDFNARQMAGELPATIDYADIDNGQYRYLKAQGVQPVCLNCHGTDVQPNVKQAIEKHYPNDLATGYSLGQIRGAFSLTKSL